MCAKASGFEKNVNNCIQKNTYSENIKLIFFKKEVIIKLKKIKILFD